MTRMSIPVRPIAVSVVALVISLLTLGGPASSGSAQGSNLELKVATTKTKIKVFGTFSGDRKAPNVRLSIRHGDEVGRKRVPLHDDGYFIGSFGRPESGDCRVRATYRSAEGPLRKSLTLPCERPEWGTGTATLIDSESNAMTTLDIEIADSAEERAYGLMYRKWLHPEKGMAFMFPTDSSGGFWMANCLIPLSIAFYDSTGTIVSILDMEPCEPQGSTNCPTYNPNATYRGALEVNKNHFDAWGIEVGDRIVISPDP